MRARGLVLLVLLVLLSSCSARQADTGSGAPAPPRARPSTEATGVYIHTRPADLASSLSGIAPRVYVPNSEGGSVDVIDAKTYKIVSRYTTGANPHHVTPAWDLSRLYVDDITTDRLVVFDPRTGKPSGRSYPVTDPYNLYFTPDGSTAIVVAERLRRLDFRDPRDWRLLKSVDIPASGPDHLDFSADGKYLLISTEYSGYVFKVEVAAGKVSGKVRVGGLPVDVRLSPDGRWFFVANQGTNGVSVIDGVAMRQVAFLPTGRGTHGLVVGRDARRIYASNRLDGSISVIDPAALKVLAKWKVGGSPDMMQISTDGTELWTANRFHSTVSVVSIADGSVRRVIRVGASPHGLSYFPQPGRFSVGHNGVYR